MKKIGFVGIGNMASTIIEGLHIAPIDKEITMLGYDHHPFKKLATLSKGNKIKSISTLNELVQESDYIILAVKPDVIDEVMQSIDKNIIKNKVFVSMAGGVDLNRLKNNLSDDAKVIRIMPNVNAKVSESMTSLVKNEFTSEEELTFVKTLFDQVGKTIIIPEKLFDIFAVVAGSLPAVVYMFIDIVANVAVKFGMNKQDANNVITQSVLGSAKFAESEAVDKLGNVRSLMDQVMSPGGTTIRGMIHLEESDFSKNIEEAILIMLDSFK